MNADLSFVDSLIVAAFGIVVVFVVLGIIILYLMLQSKVFQAIDKKTQEKQTKPQPVVSATPEVIQQNDDEIVAVISACIYTMLQDHDTVDSDAEFVIRKIEKLKWSK